jgi:hypothetical protein
MFMVAWQLLSTSAYIWNVYRFQRGTRYAARAYVGGIAGLLSAIAITGVVEILQKRELLQHWLSTPLLGVFVLAGIGGTCRGLAFSSRTWLELHHTAGAVREGYLARTEALGTLLKLVVPVTATLFMSVGANEFAMFFVFAGVVSLMGCLLALKLRIESPAEHPVNPGGLLNNMSYWRTGPFYVVDGAGHALRTGLFVSGAMSVIGSAKGFGMVESAASLCAAALLWYQSRNPKDAPSLESLRNCMAVIVLAWAALMGALGFVWLLPVFVAAYAVGHPLMTVAKSSLTLKGLAQKGVPALDNLIGRMLLLTTGRVSALGVAWTLSYVSAKPQWQLAITCLIATALLPLDYFYARRLVEST